MEDAGGTDAGFSYYVCPLKASPHQALFYGPFHANITYAKSRLKNVSNVQLIVNVKMSEPQYIRSSPRCFFINPGEVITISFTHQPFVVNPEETYYRHQVGFFYMEVPSDWSGSAAEFKENANQMGWQWELCRMRISFQFTEEDYAAANEAQTQAAGEEAGAEVDGEGLAV